MACDQWLRPIKTTTKTAAKEEEVEEPLSPATRVFHTPQMNCCIVAVVGCKTVIDVEVIKEGIYQTFVKHPRISSKLVILLLLLLYSPFLSFLLFVHSRCILELLKSQLHVMRRRRGLRILIFHQSHFTYSINYRSNFYGKVF